MAPTLRRLRVAGRGPRRAAGGDGSLAMLLPTTPAYLRLQAARRGARLTSTPTVLLGIHFQ